MSRAPAHAKLNLALVVGAPWADGMHAVTTVLQRLELADWIEVEPADELSVGGFADDTLVAAALEGLARATGGEQRFRARIEKRIPVAAGLGGGSSDAATALRLAAGLFPEPLPEALLRRVAAALGADVPFFLDPHPQLGEGDGRDLTPLDLPQDYTVVLVLPAGATKRATADVYAAFDERGGAARYEDRRDRLLAALAEVRRPRDLAALPPNDLASSPLAAELTRLGAFRADVTGAGPTVYGLFDDAAIASDAGRVLESLGRVWITAPAC